MSTNTVTFFTWLAAVLVDMEVGIRLLVLRLLFKLLMSSLFFAFSVTIQEKKNQRLNKILNKVKMSSKAVPLTRLGVAL